MPPPPVPGAVCLAVSWRVSRVFVVMEGVSSVVERVESIRCYRLGEARQLSDKVGGIGSGCRGRRRLCIAKRVVAGCAFVAQACPANFHQMAQVSTQKTFESCAMHQVGPLVCLQTEASSESCHSRPVPDDSQCCSSCPNTASLVTDTHSI